MKIKTIDINAYEWRDKINGNSYFSSVVDINYKLKSWISLKLPFQYGYGEHYIDESFKELVKELGIKTDLRCWRFCDENNIILRTNKEENCLKREVVNQGI